MEKVRRKIYGFETIRNKKGTKTMKYEIKGGNLPVVICKLAENEAIVCEGGSMSWMSDNLEMSTSGGGLKKGLGRMFSGDNAFQNTYVAKGGPGFIALASSFPGTINAVQITPERPMIVQGSAFLGSEKSVDMNAYLQKKFSVGALGGKGFVMQKLSGSGIAFYEISGHGIEYNLRAEQSIIVEPGHLVAMDTTVNIDIVVVQGLKNKLVGGEGLTNIKLTGPGRVILQTMPIANLAGAVAPYMVNA